MVCIARDHGARLEDPKTSLPLRVITRLIHRAKRVPRTTLLTRCLAGDTPQGVIRGNEVITSATTPHRPQRGAPGQTASSLTLLVNPLRPPS